MRSLTRELLDLALPNHCVYCRAPDPRSWCDGCRVDLQLRRCHTSLPFPVFAAGPYAGSLRAAILAYKERGRRTLAQPLAEALGLALLPYGSPVGPGWPALVPVPSSRSAARARGGDHVLRLATAVQRDARSVKVCRLLRVTGRAVDSVGRSATDRDRDGIGRFRARGPDARSTTREVVLIDDIVTTGSTLRDCARALSTAGWVVGGAAVLAETVLRSGAR